MLERNIMFICMLIYCILIFMVYLVKADKKTRASRLFIWVQFFVIWNILYNIIALNVFQVIKYNLDSTPYAMYLSRIYISNYVFLFGFLECYIFEVIFKKKVSFSFKEKWNIQSILLFITFMIGVLGAFFLPNEFRWDGGYFFSFWGIASNTVYVICFGLQIFNFIYYFIIRKKNNIKFKYIYPVFMVPIVFVIAIILNTKWTFSFFEMAMTLMISILYFYYERPDEKIQGLLEKSIIDYEKASRFKTDFFSNVSHEIKTPLSSIIYTLNFCKNRENISGSLSKDLDDMMYCANTLYETVSNVLIMSKIDNENHVFNKGPYSIRTELNEMPSIFKIRSRNKDVNLFIEIDPSVPELINGERELVSSIINNTLSYSNRYVKKGTISIKIDWVDESSNLIVQVNNVCPDCGNLYSNIDSELVDIYESLNNSDFGIDLACLLVKKLNGRIDFDYENNLHNSIFFTIPQEKSDIQFNIEDIKYTDLKVLVVDDNELNLRLAFKALSSLDVEVDVCNSGSTAIDYVDRKDFDIIFLDINMPNMSGEETLKHLLNKTGFNSYVVAVTADDGINSKEKYLELGFDDYLVKPFKKNDLVAKIENAKKGGNGSED